MSRPLCQVGDNRPIYETIEPGPEQCQIPKISGARPKLLHLSRRAPEEVQLARCGLVNVQP